MSKRSYLTWKQLDAMKTSTDVANLLSANGINGVRNSPSSCPLARAVRHKYAIFSIARFRDNGPNKDPSAAKLTQAESEFIRLFDTGHYPSLEYTR